MNHHIEKKISMTSDHRPLNHSRSSVFSAFVFPVIVLIIFVVNITSNLSLQSTISSRGVSEVKIEIKTVVPYLPLSSEKEGAGEDTLNQLTQAIPPRNLDIAGTEKLRDTEIFRQSSLSEKFHGRAVEFFNDGCEVNFIMTWISPAEFFGRRELLAVESVFKAHPRGCLMILSATMDSPQGDETLRPFLYHGYKVLAVTPDLHFLLNRTAGASWMEDIKSGKRDPGKIPLAQNLSNLMRIAALYKYGGVYLDTDMIVLKSFKGLRNAIGAQSSDASSRNWTRLNNAVLIFDKGHPLLLKFIEEFASTFNGNIWGHNGPYLVSRVARAVEGTPGYNFTILPPVAFYPLNWIEIERLFKVPKIEKDSRWVEAKLRQLQRKTYGLHLWNKFSKKFPIEEDSAIRRLISDHCIICKNVQR